MHRILVLAPDGVIDSSLALTHDALATANRLAVARGRAEPFRITWLNPGRRRIRTAMGATLAAEPSASATDYGALVLPGLGMADAAEIDRRLGGPDLRRAVEWLRGNAHACPLVAASCSAVFLAAEAGLLTGKAATTTWWLGSVFRQRYPDVELDETRMLVADDATLCAGAALAHMALRLHLLARTAGPELARDVPRYLLLEERPSQARFMMLSAVAGMGAQVRDIERWIRAHLAQPFTVAGMARELGMSPRTLDRRVRAATGKGPGDLVQRIRLERATHLLETSDSALDDVATAVGYGDATTLRRLLRRHLHTNPSELRRRSA